MQTRAQSADLVIARVESTAKQGTKRMSIQPFHQARRGQKAFCTVDLVKGLTEYAQAVVDRIWRIRRDENCGSFVLANAQGEVHVLSEAGLSTAGIVRFREADIVGIYAADTKAGPNPIVPSIEQMVDDLRATFLSVGFITPGDLYDDLRYGDGE